MIFEAGKSGAKATAVQTLPRPSCALNYAKRLDCGGFSAAFGRIGWLDEIPGTFSHVFAIDRSLMCVFDGENPYEIHTSLVAGLIARRM